MYVLFRHVYIYHCLSDKLCVCFKVISESVCSLLSVILTAGPADMESQPSGNHQSAFDRWVFQGRRFHQQQQQQESNRSTPPTVSRRQHRLQSIADTVYLYDDMDIDYDLEDDGIDDYDMLTMDLQQGGVDSRGRRSSASASVHCTGPSNNNTGGASSMTADTSCTSV